MAIGIVDSNTLEKELENINKTMPKAQRPLIKEIEKGRGNKPEVSEEVRKFIAQESIMGATHEDIQKEFDISRSSISAYKNGATSTRTYNTPDNSLSSHIKGVKNDISRRARSVLLHSLDSLTPEKLESVKAKDLSSIARNMAGVVKDMEDASEGGDNDRLKVQFIMFAPPIRSEDKYDVIDIQALEVE